MISSLLSNATPVTLARILRRTQQRLAWCLSIASLLVTVGALLSACAAAPKLSRPSQPASLPPTGMSTSATGYPRWAAADWQDIDDIVFDNLAEVWPAWQLSCTKPAPRWVSTCANIAALALASDNEKRQWLQSALQVYRVTDSNGLATGKLTSYYEPQFQASRAATPAFQIPIYSPPRNLGKSWYTRKEMDTVAEVQSQLAGHAWGYLSSPVDMLNLGVQGSGKLVLQEPDGRSRTVRAAYAGNNGHPFNSPMRELMHSGEMNTATWAELQTWVDKNRDNPNRVAQMMWSNPRYIFFRETPITQFSAAQGPLGAQGVALTAKRSIAVDPSSVPYGTPVWINSKGNGDNLARLVLAQDTGSAIVGAVRADFYAGSGAAAGSYAERINQPLQMWVLWPKDAAPLH